MAAPSKTNPVSPEEFRKRLDGRSIPAAAKLLGLPESTVAGWVRHNGVSQPYCDIVKARFPLMDEDHDDKMYRLGYNEAILDISTAARDALRSRGMLSRRVDGELRPNLTGRAMKKKETA